MAGAEGRSGCWKWGCLGCIGAIVVVLGLLVFLVLAGVAAGTRPQRIEDVRQQHELPQLAGEPLEIREPGRIVLDVSSAEFEIEPGPSGQPLRVEGHYDAARHYLEEDWKRQGELGWTYRLTFARRGLVLLPSFGPEGKGNRLRLVIPRDAPVILEGRIGVGESRLELGGLLLLETDLDVGIGDHEIRFGQPLPAPMKRLRLAGSIGELRAAGVGNASPATVELTHSIGEVDLDLYGTWRQDASIDVRCGIGECRVHVPRDVGFTIDRASVTLGERHLTGLDAPKQEGQPMLRLAVSGTVGQVEVGR